MGVGGSKLFSIQYKALPACFPEEVLDPCWAPQNLFKLPKFPMMPHVLTPLPLDLTLSSSSHPQQSWSLPPCSRHPSSVTSVSHHILIGCICWVRSSSYSSIYPQGSDCHRTVFPEMFSERQLKCWCTFWKKEETRLLKRLYTSIFLEHFMFIRCYPAKISFGVHSSAVREAEKEFLSLFYKQAAWDSDILWLAQGHSWKTSGQGLNQNSRLVPHRLSNVSVLLSLARKCWLSSGGNTAQTRAWTLRPVSWEWILYFEIIS